MSALPPERLAEIRADIQDDAVGEERELLAEVERLTAELATAHTAWDEWKASSRAGHALAFDMAAEVARLRAGIEYLRGAVRLGARTNAEPGAVHVLQMIHDDLVELLNPPTEGGAEHG